MEDGWGSRPASLPLGAALLPDYMRQHETVPSAAGWGTAPVAQGSVTTTPTALTPATPPPAVPPVAPSSPTPPPPRAHSTGSPPLAASIAVDILRTSTASDAGGRFTLYHVGVTLPSATWTVQRRYREFAVLHGSARGRLPAAAARCVPELPPKRVFGTLEPGVIAERRVQLAYFLQRLLRLPHALATLPELVEFLDETHQPLRRYLASADVSARLSGLTSAYARSQAQISALAHRLGALEGGARGGASTPPPRSMTPPSLARASPLGEALVSGLPPPSLGHQPPPDSPHAFTASPSLAAAVARVLATPQHDLVRFMGHASHTFSQPPPQAHQTRCHALLTATLTGQVSLAAREEGGGDSPRHARLVRFMQALARGAGGVHAFPVGAAAAGVVPLWHPVCLTALVPRSGQAASVPRLAAALSAVAATLRRWRGPSTAPQRAPESGGGDMWSPPPPSTPLLRRPSRREGSLGSASFTVGDDRTRALTAAISALDRADLTLSAPVAAATGGSGPTDGPTPRRSRGGRSMSGDGDGSREALSPSRGEVGGRTGSLPWSLTRSSELAVASLGVASQAEAQAVLAATQHADCFWDFTHITSVSSGGGAEHKLQCSRHGSALEVNLNDLRSLSAAALVQAMDSHVGRGSLFRRALVLLHAWGCHDAPRWGGHTPPPSAGHTAWLAAAVGGGATPPLPPLPWAACVSLLTWTLSRRGGVISTPLAALAWTLRDLACVPSEGMCVGVLGATPWDEVTWTRAMARAQALSAALHAMAKRTPATTAPPPGTAPPPPATTPAQSTPDPLSREAAVAAAAAAMAPVLAELEAGGALRSASTSSSSSSRHGGGVTESEHAERTSPFGFGVLACLSLDAASSAQQPPLPMASPTRGPQRPDSGASHPPPLLSTPAQRSNSGSNGTPTLDAAVLHALPHAVLNSLQRKCARRRAAEDVRAAVATLRRCGAGGGPSGILGLPAAQQHALVHGLVHRPADEPPLHPPSTPLGILHPTDPLQDTLAGWSHQHRRQLQRAAAVSARMLHDVWGGGGQGVQCGALLQCVLGGAWSAAASHCTAPGPPAAPLKPVPATAAAFISDLLSPAGHVLDAAEMLVEQGSLGAQAAAQAAISAVSVPDGGAGLWHAVEYAAFYLDSDVTGPALLCLTRELLQQRGSLPVGEVGKLLGEATSHGNLSAVLKERFGGLKKFLEAHPDEFLLGNDHAFNPHVYLVSHLTPEQARDLRSGVDSRNTPSSPAGSAGTPPSSSRKRRGGRRRKAAAAALAAAAAEAAAAPVTWGEGGDTPPAVEAPPSHLSSLQHGQGVWGGLQGWTLPLASAFGGGETQGMFPAGLGRQPRTPVGGSDLPPTPASVVRDWTEEGQ